MDTARVSRAVREEVGGLHLGIALNRRLATLLPRDNAYRIRTAILRSGGWNIHRSSMFAEVPRWSGSGPIRSRLSVGSGCWVNVGCHFELNDAISIGDGVAIGHDVLILTSTHKLGRGDRRAGELVTGPVTIGPGAWIGARSVILPGVEIGAGAVVSAGSVVNADVPANTVVAGAPASVVVPRLPR